MTLMERPLHVDEILQQVVESGRLAYRSRTLPTWCPGCGYFAIVEGVTAALHGMKAAIDQVVVVSGIGCSSRFPFFVSNYGFHTLHGRVLPVATGVKVANEQLTVIAVGGDGDGFAIGGGHLSHAAKRNVDITYLLFDNGIYGLTKGQTSPTSAQGIRSPTTPYENPDQPLNPLMMMLAYRASWVGRAYAGQPGQLRTMIAQAIAHPGFSFLHILSPCVTFDKSSRTYVNLNLQVRDLPPGHDATDWLAAVREADQEDAPALGLFYRQVRPTLGESLDETVAKAGGGSP